MCLSKGFARYLGVIFATMLLFAWFSSGVRADSSGAQYIIDIGCVYGDTDEKAKAAFSCYQSAQKDTAGVCQFGYDNWNLMETANCADSKTKQYSYLTYQTSTDRTNAITGFVIIGATGDSDTYTYNNIVYNRVDSYNNSGNNITYEHKPLCYNAPLSLYITRDPAAGYPLTGLEVSKAKSIYNYSKYSTSIKTSSSSGNCYIYYQRSNQYLAELIKNGEFKESYLTNAVLMQCWSVGSSTNAYTKDLDKAARAFFADEIDTSYVVYEGDRTEISPYGYDGWSLLSQNMDDGCVINIGGEKSFQRNLCVQILSEYQNTFPVDEAITDFTLSDMLYTEDEWYDCYKIQYKIVDSLAVGGRDEFHRPYSVKLNEIYDYDDYGDIDWEHGNKYLYFYISRDSSAGNPITDIVIDTNEYLEGYETVGLYDIAETPQNLNGGNEEIPVYAHIMRSEFSKNEIASAMKLVDSINGSGTVEEDDSNISIILGIVSVLLGVSAIVILVKYHKSR